MSPKMEWHASKGLIGGFPPVRVNFLFGRESALKPDLLGEKQRSSFMGRLAGVAVLAALTPIAIVPQNRPKVPTHDPNQAFYQAATNHLLDSDGLLAMQQQPTIQVNEEAVNEARRKLLSDESARLLRLAAELKLEMDRTGKDTLSLSVIRKAGEIEKLAKEVKAHMKMTAGRN